MIITRVMAVAIASQFIAQRFKRIEKIEKIIDQKLIKLAWSKVPSEVKDLVTIRPENVLSKFIRREDQVYTKGLRQNYFRISESIPSEFKEGSYINLKLSKRDSAYLNKLLNEKQELFDKKVRLKKDLILSLTTSVRTVKRLKEQLPELVKFLPEPKVVTKAPEPDLSVLKKKIKIV